MTIKIPLAVGAAAIRAYAPGAAAAARGAIAAARGTVSRAAGRVGRAFRRAFGLGVPELPDEQNPQTAPGVASEDQAVMVPLASRAVSAGKPSDTVDTIARMGAASGDRKSGSGQDIGESLGVGNVVSLLASIDKNVEAITSYILSGRGGGGRGGMPQEARIARRSAISPEGRTDLTGLAAAAALYGAGQLIGREREQSTQGSAPGANNLQPAQQVQGSNNNEQSTSSNYSTLDGLLLNAIEQDLNEPENDEIESNRATRERLRSELGSAQRTATGEARVSPTLIQSIDQYLEGRVARERERRAQPENAQNTSSSQPDIETERQYEPVEGSEGLDQILNDFQQIQNRESTAPPATPAGREFLPLQEREPRTPRSSLPLQERESSSSQSEPSAFRRALSTAVPRFSLSNAMDVIMGRNLSRSRAANAIDSEYTSTNINPVVETPMQQQAPTIINNNNIIQGGGQSQPSMSAETGTPSMPAGSGVPPMIGTYPTPPSSPAFNNYSN